MYRPALAVRICLSPYVLQGQSVGLYPARAEFATENIHINSGWQNEWCFRIASVSW